jgi:tryptophanyl-tRNA synthetase
MTQPVGRLELARNTREVTAAFIASGIDKKNIVSQSQVSGPPSSPGCSIARGAVGWLNRMTQFRTRPARIRGGVGGVIIGVMADRYLVYPLPTCRWRDKKQHLELS